MKKVMTSKDFAVIIQGGMKKQVQVLAYNQVI
jgi:hypothetical protein